MIFEFKKIKQWCFMKIVESSINVFIPYWIFLSFVRSIVKISQVSLKDKWITQNILKPSAGKIKLKGFLAICCVTLEHCHCQSWGHIQWAAVWKHCPRLRNKWRLASSYQMLRRQHGCISWNRRKYGEQEKFNGWKVSSRVGVTAWKDRGCRRAIEARRWN